MVEKKSTEWLKKLGVTRHVRFIFLSNLCLLIVDWMPLKKMRTKRSVPKEEALGLIKQLDKYDNLVNLAIPLKKILVLGDHYPLSNKRFMKAMETHLTEKEKFKAECLESVILKRGKLNLMPKMFVALHEANIVVMFDGKRPGTVSESTYLCPYKSIQDKTILFVQEGKKTLDQVMSTEDHYLFYPRIVFYRNKKDLKEKIVKYVKKEVYRLANLDAYNLAFKEAEETTEKNKY